MKAFRNSMLWCWAIRTPPDESGRGEWGPGFFGRGDDIDWSLAPLNIPALFSTRAKAEAYLRDYVIPHRNGARDCRVVRVCALQSVHEMEQFPKALRDRNDYHSSHSIRARKS